MKALASAYRFLAAKQHLTKQLREKLEKKGFPSEEIEHALAECTRLGYLDDDRDMRAYISKECRRGRGPNYIRQKIGDTPLIEELYLKEHEHEQIKRLLEKRSITDQKGKQKAFAFLMRRGFSSEAIWEIFNRVYSEV